MNPVDQSPSPLLIDSRQAAKMLGVSPRTVYTLQSKGELPAVRIGRSVRFSVDGLRQLIADRQAAASGQAA